MKLTYEAYDRTGSKVRDVIEAATENEAREKLQRSGLFVSTLDAGEESTRTADAPLSSGVRIGGRLKHLAIWSRHLAVLIRSGTPLTQALEAVERQTRSATWSGVLADLRHHVEEGQSLSKAMRDYPRIFDGVICSLTAAGESSGEMSEMFNRIATITRQQLKLRRTVVSALIYPAILIFIGVAVVNVMMLLVLPRFTELFESLNASIPPTTTFLMSISTFMRSYWWVILLATVSAIVCARLSVTIPTLRRALEDLMLKVPVVGALIRSLATARIARLMGVLLESRVPLLDTLDLAKTGAGLHCYELLLTSAEDAARKGETVSGVFLKSRLIVPSMSEAMTHGERNGQIAPILVDMADFLDEENEALVKVATSVLEPVILIGLGCVVGFIALSLFIPLFDLSAMAAGT